MAIQLTVKAVGADLVRKGLEDLAAETPKIARQTIYDALNRGAKILRSPGSPSRYPVQWDSEVQRRAFFASGGFGGGIPYQRTNRLPSGWTIEALPTGWRLMNPNPAAVYVYGNYEGARQSRIHQGRWPVMQEVVENAIMGLPQDIEDKISYYGRSKLG